MDNKYTPTMESIKNHLSKTAPDKLVKELDIFLCNTGLDSSNQEKLIQIFNKLLN